MVIWEGLTAYSMWAIKMISALITFSIQIAEVIVEHNLMGSFEEDGRHRCSVPAGQACTVH